MKGGTLGRIPYYFPSSKLSEEPVSLELLVQNYDNIKMMVGKSCTLQRVEVTRVCASYNESNKHCWSIRKPNI